METKDWLFLTVAVFGLGLSLYNTAQARRRDKRADLPVRTIRVEPYIMPATWRVNAQVVNAAARPIRFTQISVHRPAGAVLVPDGPLSHQGAVVDRTRGAKSASVDLAPLATGASGGWTGYLLLPEGIESTSGLPVEFSISVMDDSDRSIRLPVTKRL
jgi:hypothetical protein